ncbi:MAG: UDP-N-acetylmuramoyl-L-alanyl-D-glutamate--2,6-diaminopimelate ligase, partial [Candidatus Cloacimonetes bacterium]|nr:UDP-N-acetylmuramoyl-L-alanyl-D-glutamate--2,6-diaminopimelate ligase [Candidatus Cloacimonadota bacterium]
MISAHDFINLLQNHQIWISSKSIDTDTYIKGKPITNSNLIQDGDAFICIKGFEKDGHQFIKQAREKGASLIIQEDDFIDDFPAIRVSNSRKAAALLSKLHFNNPSSKFTLIGITGTNGKTTTSLIIWQILVSLGYKVGWIGTLGYQIESGIVPTKNTTPDIIELNEIFDTFVKSGCK